MRIQLSDHFTLRRLLRFVLPSIVMMVFTSLYSIVDGFFISNFAGKTPFAAVNLVMPLTMGVGTLGFMIGTGGSAVVSRLLGEGKPEAANRAFSFLIYFSIAATLVISILGAVFIRPLSIMLGAEGELLEYCVVYGRILFLGMTAFVLQCEFQSFFVVAEKPTLGLGMSIVAGVVNAILDWLLIGVLDLGVVGAGLATVTGQIVGGVIPVFYFIGRSNSLLRLTPAGFDGRVLLKTCTNGASELTSNLSASVVTVLYNFQLTRLAGEDGVAALGVIMYTNFIFSAVFFGYSIGSAPLVGYHFGADNRDELKNLLHKSLLLVTVSGLSMTLLSELLSWPLTAMFVSYDAALLDMTCRGFRIYSLMFLFMGYSVWGSSFFTALSNGLVSALISLMRMLVFQTLAIFTLPYLLGLDGVWISNVAAELLAAAFAAVCFVKMRKKYGYM